MNGITEKERRALRRLDNLDIEETGGVLHWGNGVSHRTAAALVRLGLAEFAYDYEVREERATRRVWALRGVASKDPQP